MAGVDASSFEHDAGGRRDQLKADGLSLYDLQRKLLDSGLEETDAAVVAVKKDINKLATEWGDRPLKSVKGFKRAVNSYRRELERKDKKSSETGAELEADYMSGYEAVGDTGTERRAVLSLNLNEYFIETTHVTDVVEDLIHNTPPLAPSHLTDDTDKDLQKRAIAVVFKRFPKQMKGLYRDLALPKESHNYEKAMASLESMKNMLQEQYEFLSEVKSLREEVETQQLIEGAESKFKNMAKEVIDNPGKSLLLAGGLILSLTALYQLKYGKKIIKFLGFSAAGAAGLTAGAFGLDWVVKAASDDNTGLFDRLGFNPATFSESAALARFEHLFDEMHGLNNQAMLDLIRIGNEPIGNVLNKFNAALSSGKKSISPLAFNLDTERESDMNEDSIYKAIRGVVLEGAERAGKKGDEYAGIKYLRERFGKDFTVFNVLMHMNNKGGTLGELNPDGSLASTYGVNDLVPSSPKESAQAMEVRAIFRSFAGLDKTDVSPAGEGMMIINGYPLNYKYEHDERQNRGVHVFEERVVGTSETPRKFRLEVGPNGTIDGRTNTAQAVAKAIRDTIDIRMQARFEADKELMNGGPSGATVKYNYEKHQWKLDPPWEIKGLTQIGNTYAGVGERFADISFFVDEKYEDVYVMYKGVRYDSLKTVKAPLEKASVERKIRGDMGYLIGNLPFTIKEIKKTGEVNIEYGEPTVPGQVKYNAGNVVGFTIPDSPELEKEWETMAEANATAFMTDSRTLGAVAELTAAFQAATNTPSLSFTSLDGWKQWAVRTATRVTGSEPINMNHEQMWIDQILHHINELEVGLQHEFMQQFKLKAPRTDLIQDKAWSGGGIGTKFMSEIQRIRASATGIAGSTSTTVENVDYVRGTETGKLREANWHNSTFKDFMNDIDGLMDRNDSTGQEGLHRSRKVRNHIRLMIYELSYPISANTSAPSTLEQQYLAWIKQELPKLLNKAEVDSEGNFFFFDRRYNQASISSAFEAAGIVSFEKLSKNPELYISGVLPTNFGSGPVPTAPGIAPATAPGVHLPGLPDLFSSGAPSYTPLPTNQAEFDGWFESEIDTMKYWNTSLAGTAWNGKFQDMVNQRKRDIITMAPGLSYATEDILFQRLSYFVLAELAVYDSLKMRGVKPGDLTDGGDTLWTQVVNPAFNSTFGIYNSPIYATGFMLSPIPITGDISAYKTNLLNNLNTLLPPHEKSGVEAFRLWFEDNNDIVQWTDALNLVDALRWQTTFNNTVETRLQQVLALPTSSTPAGLKLNMEHFKNFITAETELVWKPYVVSGRAPDVGNIIIGTDVTRVIKLLDIEFKAYFLNKAPSHRTISSYKEGLQNLPDISGV